LREAWKPDYRAEAGGEPTTYHGPIDVRLYTIPGSHPGIAAQLMLQQKRIEYKRTDLIPVAAKGILKLLRFPRVTVPAMKIDGRRVQGSTEIARELESLVPEPPLFPADPERRAAVEEAERFGDEELQHPIRQILWWTLRKDREPLRSYSEGANLGVPVGLAVKTAAPIVAAAAHFNEAGDENVEADLAKLPGMLDRIDGWIADGVLGAEQPNAGDLQIAPSLRLAMTLDDLRPPIEARPCGKLALRIVPKYPGNVPPILPHAWLEPLKSTVKSAA
jgi:glutathione S-transferase